MTDADDSQSFKLLLGKLIDLYMDEAHWVGEDKARSRLDDRIQKMSPYSTSILLRMLIVDTAYCQD